MHDTYGKDRIGIVVTIVGHGQGKMVAQQYKKEHSNMIFQYICHASGTASSEILDYLGLEDVEKDVVISLLPTNKIYELMQGINHALKMGRPGGGIAFSLRLSALNSYVCSQLEEKGEHEEDVNYSMDKEARYELILTIVNHGFADKVMSAAKKEGARGGTVIEARLLGTEEASRFLGITIKEEKEIVAIVAHKESKAAIMQAINHQAGIRTEGKGILMALPVDELVGFGGSGDL